MCYTARVLSRNHLGTTPVYLRGKCDFSNYEVVLEYMASYVHDYINMCTYVHVVAGVKVVKDTGHVLRKWHLSQACDI